MEKYKHRKSLICNLTLYNLAVESNYELFDEKPSRGDMNVGCCALLAFFIGLIVFLVCLTLYKGYPEHLQEVFIGFPLLLILILEFLLPTPLPICDRFMRKIQDSEISDGLKPSEQFGLYLHYFVFRNHPLLSKWSAFTRIVGIVVVYLLSTVFTNNIIVCLSVIYLWMLYLTYKLAYICEG